MVAADVCSTPSRVTTKRKTGQGIRLTGQTKTILCNVYDYFTTLHKKGRSDGPFKRTADATNKPYLVSLFLLAFETVRIQKIV